MKIALASVRIIDRDIQYNLSQMERYMKEAKADGADLICFGEAFLQGFNALSWEYEEDQKTAITTSSKEFEQIKMWTKKISIDVLFGYNEIEDACIYSSCALVADDKILCNYRRISKGWKEYWKTDEHYREGETVELFDYKGKKCAIGLCGDLWDHPERFTLGEDLLFWPVYVCWTKEEWENGGKIEYAQQANLCCENTLYVNSVCEGDAFGGAAQFCGGKIQRELPITKEGLLYVEVLM
ncbi:MAG TPA: carbon-nitrogen hydrolase family protein [Candidatus Caccomorpha excrementavium]|nr:carbon-nitrogen hydrolase family protein [Candidatus Caccomorpha excrementavium]